jgi:hypothetical protein
MTQTSSTQVDSAQTVERQLLHFLAKTVPDVERAMRNCRHIAREEAVNFVQTESKESQAKSKAWLHRTANFKQVLDLLKSDPLVSDDTQAVNSNDSIGQVVLIDNGR